MTRFGPIRTALFVPGSRPDRVDKALNAGADMIVIDLEDAVPLALKEETRSKVREKVLEHGGRKIIVRVNAIGSGFCQGDLDEVMVKPLGCVMLPKVESPEQIREINHRLVRLEEERGMDSGTVSIIPLIESASAVQNIFPILSEKTKPARLLTAAFGAADYSLDLGMEITKQGSELSYPRSRIAVACRAAKIEPPLDTPFMIDLKDTEGLKADAMRAKQLGFQGKLCIHPNQIQACHAIFSPTQEEIQHAERVIQAFEDAEAQGVAAIQLDGSFIDYPVFERARRTLKIAEKMERGKLRRHE
jgi:citrate lyase subunit beta/citryl-CoA lyase